VAFPDRTGVLRQRTEPALYLLDFTCGDGRLETVMERRKFLMAGAMGAASMLPRGVLGGRAYAATAHPPTGCADTSAPNTPPLEKYVDLLPRPMTAIPDPSVYPGADYYEITMRQGSWRFHRDLGPATVWGYWATNPHDPDKAIGMGYLGPTIRATHDHPTVVKWRNELPTRTCSSS
jgi:spore coat protein A